ncbi:hypothetical protein CYFUS_006037 [Cystobacter fuscus]|uniref:Lipoprotein n=1 Tax=Cystobacter fuscus TaxID=43 RepID=A0A250JBM8_9BACT|nr:hypothetical protein [Cystobacter fuscus]ATB40586.1 hypothetical protein CYFUS_006037 [Cystobacter fuscus]
MAHSPLRQAVPASALVSLLALACNNPPPVTIPDPPQVTVRLEETSTVGRGFKLSISTSGCDQVQRLELFNDTTRIKQVPYGGNPTPVELARDEISYAQGLAVPLSLSARVTCADGRTNVSQGQVATFFPVEEVVEPATANTQVVPDYFVVDGSGNSVSFIGCAMDGTRPFLYRVDKSNPSSAQRVEINFPCDATTLITDRKPAGTGTRWVWTPGRGLLSLDASFKVIYSTNAAVENLVVAADGNAFIYNVTGLYLVTPQGQVRWSREYTGAANPLPGRPAGDPVHITSGTQAGRVLVPLREEHTETVNLRVVVLDYATTDPNGKQLAQYEIDELNPIQAAWTAFNDTGTVMYLGTQQQGSATVRACALGQTKPCQSTYPQSRLWISDPIPGALAALIPYANNNRLAVITSNRFWFMDVKRNSPTESRIINKDQQALTPTGALVGRFAQPGKDDAFFMFNSAPGTSDVPNPYPVEIVATDAAEQGLLYRYQIPGGLSLYGALDDAGTLWMRAGRKLVKPYSLTEYRQLR